MGDGEEGYLMIGVAALLLITFSLVVLAVMIIYRKRKLQHTREVAHLNAIFSQELLQTQLEVQQHTMQQIGREIHDNVGQKLTLATLYALQVENGEPAQQEKMEGMIAILHESLADLRSLSKDLTDNSYGEASLSILLAKECRRVEATGYCTATLHAGSVMKEVPTAVRHIALRIVQEFIHNSLKHARCTAIQVYLEAGETGLHIRATDNGLGFDPGAADNPGIGLANMEKRAKLINGQLSLSSKPGSGTALTLCIPLQT